jgi:hypothetical protein
MRGGAFRLTASARSHARQQKITLAKCAPDVRGLLIYCSNYHCSHCSVINATDGPIMFGCPI